MDSIEMHREKIEIANAREIVKKPAEKYGDLYWYLNLRSNSLEKPYF
jgi:hypothetical protein